MERSGLQSDMQLYLNQITDVDLLTADVALTKGDVEQARKLYAGLVEQGQRGALTRLVSLEMRGRNIDGAVSLLEGWLDDAPNDAEARSLLANVLVQTKSNWGTGRGTSRSNKRSFARSLASSSTCFRSVSRTIPMAFSTNSRTMLSTSRP